MHITITTKKTNNPDRRALHPMLQKDHVSREQAIFFCEMLMHR